MSQQEKLRSAAEKLCKDLNIHLFNVEVKGNKNNPLFLVFADTSAGITLKECEKLSRLIQDEIDFSDDFPEKYRLDVSSPGLDMPLVEEFQFTRNIDRELSLSLINQSNPVEGKLKSFNSEVLSIEDEKGNVKEYIRSTIKEAKVKLKW